jgi:hypothetical protein
MQIVVQDWSASLKIFVLSLLLGTSSNPSHSKRSSACTPILATWRSIGKSPMLVSILCGHDIHCSLIQSPSVGFSTVKSLIVLRRAAALTIYNHLNLQSLGRRSKSFWSCRNIDLIFWLQSQGNKLDGHHLEGLNLTPYGKTGESTLRKTHFDSKPISGKTRSSIIL